MNHDELINTFREMGCLPFQAEFAADFFDANSPSKHLLVSSPGFGKSFAVSEMVEFAVSTGQARRILILAPSLLMTSQWTYRLHREVPNLPIYPVDRRRFRELELFNEDGNSPWPDFGAVLMTIHLARQPDVSEILAKNSWDLLVVDEIQRLHRRTQLGPFITHLLDFSPGMRSILLSSNGKWYQEQNNLLLDRFPDLAVTQWSRENIQGDEGNMLLPEVKFEWIRYQRTREEVELLKRLEDLLRSHIQQNRSERFASINLLQTASSSLFALEHSLRRIRQRRNEITHGLYRPNENEPYEEIYGGEEVDTRTRDQRFKAILELDNLAFPLLQTIEEISTDSKFTALEQLINTIRESGDNSNRICILTEFDSTATFLSSALEERFGVVNVLTGRSSFEDGVRVIHSFEETGGILIVTGVAATSLPKPEVVIFYDIPLRPDVLEERISLFSRVSRTESVRFCALYDESNSSEVERLTRLTPGRTEPLSEDALFEHLGPKNTQ